jgi:hypothetical protein
MKLITKIRKAKNNQQKTDILLDANLMEWEYDELTKEMVLSLPKGGYKLHSREYGTNLRDAIYDLYGWMPSILVSEEMLLGLEVVYPKKVHASFTLGIDKIEIK